MMADAVLELRPASTAGPGSADSHRWPIFAIVLDQRAAPNDAGVRRLFALLDRCDDASQITVVGGHHRLSPADWRRDLLRIAVRAIAPVRCDLDILLPARPVRDVLHRLDGGATLAITSRASANGFADQVQTKDALQHLVLLSRAPAAAHDV